MDYPNNDTEARLANGKFTDGDVTASPVVPPSKNSAVYQNMVFDELLNVITAGGLTPSDQSVTQLIEAINNVIASAITAGIANKTDTGHSHTSSDLTDFGTAVEGLFTQSLTETGYCQMPGGLVIQWGRESVNGGSSKTVMFPVVFPSECFVAVPVAGGTASGGGNYDYFGVSGITDTQFTVTSGYNGVQNIVWVALGK